MRDRQLPGRLGRDNPCFIRPELFGPIILAGAPLSYWRVFAAKIRCAIRAACSAAAG